MSGAPTRVQLREAERAEEAAAVIEVLAQRYELSTDPQDERGYKGEWHQTGRAIDTLIRVLVQGFGWTQGAAAVRAGFSEPRGGNARRPPELYSEEAEVLEAALEMLGRGEADEPEPPATLRVRWCAHCGRVGLRGEGAHSRETVGWSPILGTFKDPSEDVDYSVCHGRTELIEYRAPAVVGVPDGDA